MILSIYLDERIRAGICLIINNYDMYTVKRKFKCIGCGKDRPCIVETNQEPMNNILDNVEMFIEDLKCILDSTNQTTYFWHEIDAD